MKPESENYEFKSILIDASGWFKLIKTSVAMANTKGGTIEIKKVEKTGISQFDTARIDDKINGYISPRIQNITTKIFNNLKVKIFIPNSSDKPHVFIKRGNYPNPNPPPQQKTEFYEGQGWVRHSGKNETITKDDFDRIFKQKLDDFLKRINIIAAQFPLSAKELKVVQSDSAEAIPIKVMDRGKGLPVLKERVDPNLDYPYNAKILGQSLNKSQSFIATMATKLGLKEQLQYALKVKNPQGKIIMVKYSEDAFVFLRKYLISNPDYNPYLSSGQV